MSELSKFEAYKKKLQGVCEEHNLTFRFSQHRYPITMTIRPVNGLEGQLSLLEDSGGADYINPDAKLVFAYNEEGEITWQTSETFTIDDALHSKLKALFRNLTFRWLQYFHRDLMTHGNLRADQLPQEYEEDADRGLPDGSDDAGNEDDVTDEM